MAIVNYTTFTLLSVVNLYYALRYITRMYNKMFHLMMFLILQTCFICLLAQVKLFEISLINWQNNMPYLA